MFAISSSHTTHIKQVRSMERCSDAGCVPPARYPAFGRARMARNGSGAQFPCASTLGDPDGWRERDEQSIRDEDNQSRPSCVLRSGSSWLLVSRIFPLTSHVRHSFPSIPLGTTTTLAFLISTCSSKSECKQLTDSSTDRWWASLMYRKSRLP